MVTRYIGATSTRLQTWARIRGYVGLWSFLGYGYWAIEERISGSFVGELGFADFKREISPLMQGVPEMGWALVSSAHGKGYASEATLAALAWGDANLPSSRTVCLIHPENLASIRIAQKCGFAQFDSAVYLESPTLFFERYRDGSAS